MPIVVLLAIFLQVDAISWTVIIGGILMTIWLSLAAQHVLAKPPQTKNAVLKWLSGMCLIDAYLLCVLGQPIAALVAGGCFVVTTLGHRKILGT